MRIVSALAAAALSIAVVSQAHAVIIMDGNLDATYGAATAHVAHDPGAPLGDFSGGPSNHYTSYDIFLRYDSGNVYGFLQNNGPGATSGLPFANLYWDLNPSTGSDLGFEVGNNRAFIPATGVNVAGLDLQLVSSSGGLEFRIPASYFTTVIPGLSYTPVNMGDTIQLRLSQSLGYSVAGGETYGDARLGEIQIGNAVPEPSTWAMMLIGFAGLGFMAYRRTRKLDALAEA